MTQLFREYNSPFSLYAENNILSIDTNETIVLEDIPVAGYRNIGVSVLNHSTSAGSISAIKLYGSNDGFHWFNVSTFSLATITAGNMGHTETTAMFKYIRITATAVSTATIDISLVAQP